MAGGRTSAGAGVAAAMLLLAACAGTGDDRIDLAGLRPGHPRLFLTRESLTELDRITRIDPTAREWRKQVTGQAAALLKEQPSAREFEPRRPVLLPTSRRVLDRVQTLGLAYLLERDRRFLERARQELLASAAFPDWNPSHFLDVAEMANAVATGYDWLHDDLSEADRGILRRALVEKALEPALAAYAARTWWTRATHNWNLVCNGGIVVAALAVADHEPERAAQIVAKALASARPALAGYGPDGGWNEGPGYWDYATRYAVTMMAALESALGDDRGVSATPGFATTGRYLLHLQGPTGLVFNFADGGDRVGRVGYLQWLARRFGDPVDTWLARGQRGAAKASDLLWFTPAATAPAAAGVRPAAYFRGVEVVAIRGAWGDPKATFVAVKGGDNAVNHANLDLGDFVLDFAGTRFAVDLGADDYSLPGYFDGRRRWGYYRTGTAGQNTLIVDGANQPAKAKAPVVLFRDGGRAPRAMIDLGAAYPALSRAARGVALIGGRDVLVMDEVDRPRPVVITWQMHTRATVEPAGSIAVLRDKAAILNARILSPAGAVFRAVSAERPPPENPNRGVVRLTVELPPATGPARIAVLFGADGLPPEAGFLLEGLDRWRSEP